MTLLDGCGLDARMVKLRALFTGASRPQDQAKSQPEEGSTIARPVHLQSRPTAAPACAPPPTNTRAAERFAPRRTRTILEAGSGRKVEARIINISATGVAVEADFAQISPADIVKVGTHAVTPGRRLKLGAAFQFVTPLTPGQCTPDLVL